MRRSPAFEPLLAAARAGDRRATGRLITLVEDDADAAAAVLGAIYPDTHAAWITGITGAPGTGKSTLVDQLIRTRRQLGLRVAVLAVDPTSPFTGGALLGDRIRMQFGASDSGVLVRSMATRGWLGGMARATERVAILCAGLGYDEVLIETVGVGQSEVDIAAAADTTLVVVTPGFGDGVQVAKAGIMEIADVFVVNKADRAGAAEMAGELVEMLRTGSGAGWQPPVVTTVATTGMGVPELVAAIDSHRQAVTDEGGDARLRDRRRRDFRRALAGSVEAALRPMVASPRGVQIEAAVVAGQLDPWSGAAALLAELGTGDRAG